MAASRRHHHPNGPCTTRAGVANRSGSSENSVPPHRQMGPNISGSVLAFFLQIFFANFFAQVFSDLHADLAACDVHSPWSHRDGPAVALAMSWIGLRDPDAPRAGRAINAHGRPTSWSRSQAVRGQRTWCGGHALPGSRSSSRDVAVRRIGGRFWRGARGRCPVLGIRRTSRSLTSKSGNGP
jgi:hypothetical protein